LKIVIIAALAGNRVIGNKGKIPWHLSDDLKRFKQLTMGHTVIMGRKSYESIGKPLPGRRNIVITSRTIPGVECAPSLEAALQTIQREATVFIIGGGMLYAAALPLADAFYLTHVDGEYTGDTFFPDCEQFLKNNFTPVTKEQHPGFTFETWEKK
jgi:dihydrofolate reductase